METLLQAGDLVVLPESDPLLPSLRPVGVGLVLGRVDTSGMSEEDKVALESCFEVMFPDRVHRLHSWRLQVVAHGGERCTVRSPLSPAAWSPTAWRVGHSW